MVRPIEPGLQAKYNKYYIGLANNGIAKNFVKFQPRKQHVVAEFSIPRSDELTNLLDESGLDMMPYDVRWRSYRARLTEQDIERHESELVHLMRTAHDSYGS